jgi:hypothetical protein
MWELASEDAGCTGQIRSLYGVDRGKIQVGKLSFKSGSSRAVVMT